MCEVGIQVHIILRFLLACFLLRTPIPVDQVIQIVVGVTPLIRTLENAVATVPDTEPFSP